MAVIYVSPLEDESFNLVLHNALLKAVQKYGIEYKYTDSVAVGDAERIGRTYADLGYKLMFFHSWYPEAIKTIVSNYPDINVLGAGTGVELVTLYPPPETIPPNYGHYDYYLQEPAYLAGVLAGKMTKTNKIGMLGGYPTGNTNRIFNGFIQGAKEANGNAEIKVSWTMTWTDPPKAKEATKALIEWGADIISTDRIPGAEQATEEASGVYLIHNLGNLPNSAPKSMIAGVPWILDSTVDGIINSTLNGKLVLKEYMSLLADGGCDFIIDQPDKVPADVMQLVNTLKQEIIEGKLVINPNTSNPEQVWGL